MTTLLTLMVAFYIRLVDAHFCALNFHHFRETKYCITVSNSFNPYLEDIVTNQKPGLGSWRQNK